jgi:ketosteroid isomerase-like protein
MIYKSTTVALYILILSSFLACDQQKPEEKKSIDKEEVKQVIQNIENNFALTFNNRNTNDLDYYADDAISYFAAQEPIVGKDAIHKHIQDELLDFPEGGKITFKTLEIYVSDNGHNVAEIGAHELHDSLGTLLQKGHYMSFFRLENGKYLCVRDMANSFQVYQEEEEIIEE